MHFYCSSGGNAGLACVSAAAALGRRATVVVPATTPPHMVAKLQDLGAKVVQFGGNWTAADRHLREEFLSKHDPAGRAVYVPPFDHPHIWEGAASIVDELVVQMRDVHGGAPLDGIACSVGGGGLLNGIMQGLERYYAAHNGGWANRGRVPRVLGVETAGANCLNASVRAGELVTLPGITSIATSLGALRVAEKTFEWFQRSGDDVVSTTVTDAEAVMGCAGLLDDARMLVEPACGATIATAYNGDLRRYFGKGLSDEEWARKNIVLIVCGGSNINLRMLQDYKTEYGV